MERNFTEVVSDEILKKAKSLGYDQTRVWRGMVSRLLDWLISKGYYITVYPVFSEGTKIKTFVTTLYKDGSKIELTGEEELHDAVLDETYDLSKKHIHDEEYKKIFETNYNRIGVEKGYLNTTYFCALKKGIECALNDMEIVIKTNK